MLFIALILTPTGTSALGAQKKLASSGRINYSASASTEPIIIDSNSESIVVNTGTSIGVNTLSLGFQLDGRDINTWRTSTALQNLAKAANFKIVRFFPQRLSSGDPCTGWNPATWNWAQVDDLISKIEAIGAKPMPVLGFCGSSGWSSPPRVPNTAEDFAEYCREWVKHFGNRITIYEVINEPHHGFSRGEFTAQEFVTIYTTAVRAMKQENPNILVGNDNSMISWSQGGVSNWRNYFAAQINPNDIDFLSWHRYITGSMSESDSSIISKSETNEGCTYGSTTMLDPSRQLYNSEGHGLLPVIQSEANLNYGFSSGTDPRNQKIINAVSHALSLKLYALKGYVTYNIFFDFAGRESSDENFGMVNLDTNEPWHVYYVQSLIGNNLAIGDTLIDSESSSSDISSLAWKNNGKTNILVICKVDQTRSTKIYGISNSMNIFRLDDNSPNIQTGNLNTGQELILNGYSVVLLQEK